MSSTVTGLPSQLPSLLDDESLNTVISGLNPATAGLNLLLIEYLDQVNMRWVFLGQKA